MKTIILVHPSMSPKMTFSIIKSKGYKIFSIITGFESNRIDSNFVKSHSDYLFLGSNSVEIDFKAIDKIVSENKLIIAGVINGIDSTVYYADFLTKKYIDNNVNLNDSKVRLNKNSVNLRLMQHNIPIIRGIEMVSISEIDDIKQKLTRLEFPIVGKPTENTAAMSGFRVLHNINDIDLYINDFFYKNNPYYHDKIIDKIIFQEYIDRLTNKEFVLDFVSYKGKHFCRSIIHYDKEIISGDFPISRFYRALSVSTNPELAILVDYVKACLTALNVQHGMTHNEVFFDGNSRVLLIESNNRVAGGGLLELMDSVYGSNPVNDYLKLISNNVLPDIEVTYNAIALDVHNNYVDYPEKINLSGLTSQIQILHFRNKKRNPKNFFKNYSRVENVNACLLLSNNSAMELEKDLKKIVLREKNGNLFTTMQVEGALSA